MATGSLGTLPTGAPQSSTLQQQQQQSQEPAGFLDGISDVFKRNPALGFALMRGGFSLAQGGGVGRAGEAALQSVGEFNKTQTAQKAASLEAMLKQRQLELEGKRVDILGDAQKTSEKKQALEFKKYLAEFPKEELEFARKVYDSQYSSQFGLAPGAPNFQNWFMNDYSPNRANYIDTTRGSGEVVKLQRTLQALQSKFSGPELEAHLQTLRKLAITKGVEPSTLGL